MRFTVTLDEDVAAGIKEEMERSGESFKQVVNRLIRLAHNAPHPADGKEREAKPVRRRRDRKNL